MSEVEQLHTEREGRVLAESILGSAKNAIVIREFEDGEVFVATTDLSYMQAVGLIEWGKTLLMNRAMYGASEEQE